MAAKKPKLPAIEFWAMEDIVPDPNNARAHTTEQIGMLARAIEEFGFTIPVMVNLSGMITAGHARVEAAAALYADGKELRMAGGEKIPSGYLPVFPVDWSDDDRRAYAIADNRLAELSTWDDSLLKLELGELQDAGINVDAMGFSEAELADVMAFGTVVEKQAGKAAGKSKVTHTCPNCGTQFSNT